MWGRKMRVWEFSFGFVEVEMPTRCPREYNSLLCPWGYIPRTHWIPEVIDSTEP
jgi:hypothetical protein